MRRAQTDKLRYLLISVLTLLLAVALTVLSYMSFSEAEYGFMALLAVLSAICYYVSLFQFFGFLDTRNAIDLIDTLDYTGLRADGKVQDIADAMGWKKAPTKKLISKCKKRGYLR